MGGRWRTTLRAARRRDQRGASAVEFALVMPLVVALLFACLSFGFIFFHNISLDDSVRAGARFGATAVSPSDLPVNWPAQTVWQRTTDHSRDTLIPPAGEPNRVCVAMIRAGVVIKSYPASLPATPSSASSCALSNAPLTPTGTAATECLVKVWAARPDSVLAPPLYVSTIMLHRGSVARYERPCL